MNRLKPRAMLGQDAKWRHRRDSCHCHCHCYCHYHTAQIMPMPMTSNDNSDDNARHSLLLHSLSSSLLLPRRLSCSQLCPRSSQGQHQSSISSHLILILNLIRSAIALPYATRYSRSVRCTAQDRIRPSGMLHGNTATGEIHSDSTRPPPSPPLTNETSFTSAKLKADRH